MANYPVWQDKKVSIIPDGDSVDYTISVDGNIIFNGKTYRMSGSDRVKIYINRVVRDYLSSKIEFNSANKVQTQDRHVRSFVLSTTSPNNKTTYNIYNDYGYDDGAIVDDAINILSRPLSNVVDPRQILFCTFADLTSNTSHDIAVKSQREGKTLTSSVSGKCKTFTIDNNVAGDTITVTNVKAGKIIASYDVRATCADYCLYYLNAHGGFDHLLIKGNSLRTDDFKRVELTRNVNNTTLQHGRQSVSVEVQSKWKLYTDHLTDDQWALTHHLLGSTQVFLHDFATDDIIPVVITANSAEWRTYANQGKKKSYLTIDVEAASKRMRK